MLDAYLNVWELGYFEVGEAFKGLRDEHVWRRPASGLLSIGELAGHVAFWEAVKFAGEGWGQDADLSKCTIKSPFVDKRFAYYTSSLPVSLDDAHLSMTAEQVLQELLRVHRESVESLKARNAAMDAREPGWPEWASYEEFVKYAIFHVSYHTGQIYSARHLLGETTPDN
jgi:hypothetical protein